MAAVYKGAPIRSVTAWRSPPDDTEEHAKKELRPMFIRVLPIAALLITFGGVSNAQTNEPIKIGVLDDMSSVYADLTGESSVIAARMAVEDFGGKVLGRPIEVVVADHLNKTDNAVSIARRWFDVENVEMITGLANSAVSLAVRNVTKEKGKIDIVTGAASSDLTGQGLFPDRLPLGLRHLLPGQINRHCRRELGR
jgi:ABC-type branched-subunit amino acid transport system substrate-binding protein